MLIPRYDIVEKIENYIHLYFEQDDSKLCYTCAHCDNFLVKGFPILKNIFDCKFVSSCKLYRLPAETCPKYFNGYDFYKKYDCYNDWFHEDDNGLKEGLTDEDD